MKSDSLTVSHLCVCVMCVCLQLKAELVEQQNRKPSDKLKKMVKALKQQLAAKEKQLRNLQQAIETLRNDVESSGIRNSGGLPGGGGGGVGEADEQMKELLSKQVSSVPL